MTPSPGDGAAAGSGRAAGRFDLSGFELSGSELEVALRRLRARPARSWSHGEREAVARAALQRLADAAADAEGRLRREVPDVGVRALPDQLAVLVADCRAAGVPAAVLDAEVAELLARLSA